MPILNNKKKCEVRLVIKPTFRKLDGTPRQISLLRSSVVSSATNKLNAWFQPLLIPLGLSSRAMTLFNYEHQFVQAFSTDPLCH